MVKMCRMRVGIDLDETILDYGKDIMNCQPLPGALKTLKRYNESGYKILIFTARADAQRFRIIKWLNMHHIPFDDLQCGKPYYDILIDDKARHFKGWHLEYIDDELIKQREDMVKKWGEPYET